MTAGKALLRGLVDFDRGHVVNPAVRRSALGLRRKDENHVVAEGEEVRVIYLVAVTTRHDHREGYKRLSVPQSPQFVLEVQRLVDGGCPHSGLYGYSSARASLNRSSSGGFGSLSAC